MKLEQVKLLETMVLTEGTKYDKQAIEILVNSGLFNEDTATKIINSLFRGENGHPEIDAFNHAPGWLEKYLKGIARMIVEESNGNRNEAARFLESAPQVFHKYLSWVRENRTPENSKELDDGFVNTMKYQDVVDFVEKVDQEREEQSQKELADMEFSKSNFTLVPIDSYEQMHELYGGHWTGDGTDKEGQYAGGGGSSWCHTNNKSVYQSYLNRDGGGNKFFVLQNNDYKNIKYNPETNQEMAAKDEYGNSLIALLVSPKGKLKCATLRCNHKGNVQGDADLQYKTYAELSRVAGFNVYDEIKKYYDIPDFDASKMFVIGEGNSLIRNSQLWTAYEEECKEALTKYEIPDGVQIIGDGVFNDCTALKEVIMKDSVEVIGEKAFFGTPSLEKIKLPSGVFSIGNKAFAYSGIPIDELPEGLTVIGDEAFGNCDGIVNLTIPSNVSMIGNSAFVYCSNITSVEFKCNKVKMGRGVFRKCGRLEKVINLPEITSEDGISWIPSNLFDGAIIGDSLKIKEGVKVIGEYAFSNCNIKELDLPSSLEQIGAYAFSGCRQLTNVNMKDGIIRIGEASFYSCDKLISINIPESVNRIGESAFSACKSLSTINIPKNIERIGAGAFYYCIGLTSPITIPGSVKTISRRLFAGAEVREVTIEEGVQKIEEEAFAGSDIENLTLPNSIVDIEYDAIPSSVTVTTENMYVVNWCMKNGNKVKSSLVKEGKPYFIYTYEDFAKRYTDVDEEDFVDMVTQVLPSIYKNGITFDNRIDDKTYRIEGNNFTKEAALLKMAMNLMPDKYNRDSKLDYLQESFKRGMNLKQVSLNEKIVKKGSKYQVQSEKGKNLGTYDTKKEAEERLQQVHYFKHKDDIKEAKQDQPLKSNGVYSVLKDEWVKEPVQTDIPDIDYGAFEEQFKVWEDRYFDLVEDEGSSNEKKIEDIENLIEDIYEVRKESIAKDGEYSIGNLLFKEFRNLGYLDNLKDLKNIYKSKELSLE